MSERGTPVGEKDPGPPVSDARKAAGVRPHGRSAQYISIELMVAIPWTSGDLRPGTCIGHITSCCKGGSHAAASRTREADRETARLFARPRVRQKRVVFWGDRLLLARYPYRWWVLRAKMV